MTSIDFVSLSFFQKSHRIRGDPAHSMHPMGRESEPLLRLSRTTHFTCREHLGLNECLSGPLEERQVGKRAEAKGATGWVRRGLFPPPQSPASGQRHGSWSPSQPVLPPSDHCSPRSPVSSKKGKKEILPLSSGTTESALPGEGRMMKSKRQLGRNTGRGRRSSRRHTAHGQGLI